jgi:uncharacterized protein YycO
MSEESQTYRKVQGVLLDRSIPVLRLPKENSTEHLEEILKNVKPGFWSHAQIAVPKKGVNLAELGFKKTRMAIPLPGEKWFTPSYRAGKLHAHDAEGFYLIHEDKADPNRSKLRHLLDDVPKALRLSWSNKVQPFVKKAEGGISMSKAGDLLKPGDILLAHRVKDRTTGNWVIEKAQGTPFAHSAIYAGDKKVVHTFMGEGAESLSLNKFNKNYEYQVYRPDVSAKQRRDAVNFAKQVVDEGRGYDLVAAIKGWSPLHSRGVTKKDRQAARDSSTFNCGGLIAAAYPDVNWGHGKKATEVIPKDFATSTHTRLMGTVLSASEKKAEATEGNIVSLQKASSTRLQREWQKVHGTDKAFADNMARASGELGLKPRYLKDVSIGGNEAGVDLMMGAPQTGHAPLAGGYAVRKMYKPDSPLHQGEHVHEMLKLKQHMTNEARGIPGGSDIVPDMGGHAKISPGRDGRFVSYHEYVPGIKPLPQDNYRELLGTLGDVENRVIKPMAARDLPMHDAVMRHPLLGTPYYNLGNVVVAPNAAGADTPRILDFLSGDLDPAKNPTIDFLKQRGQLHHGRLPEDSVYSLGSPKEMADELKGQNLPHDPEAVADEIRARRIGGQKDLGELRKDVYKDKTQVRQAKKVRGLVDETPWERKTPRLGRPPSVAQQVDPTAVSQLPSRVVRKAPARKAVQHAGSGKLRNLALAGAGLAGLAGGGYLLHKHLSDKEKAASVQMRDALLLELQKLGTITDEQAREALDRYETLEKNTPKPAQIARYAGLGAVAGPMVTAIGRGITGGRDPNQSFLHHLAGSKGTGAVGLLRGVAGSAVTGAIGSGAIPIGRTHLDRRAEMGKLRSYMQEAPERHQQSAGVVAPTFEPVEEPMGGVSKLGAVKKQKDSAALSNTPANHWNGQGIYLNAAFEDEGKNAFATSQYDAPTGEPASSSTSSIPSFSS